MELLDELKNVISAVSRFAEEGKQIIKTIVSDAARANDGLLLKVLLENEQLRDVFFTKVDDVFVFDNNKIVWLLESKDFLTDQYTLYRNKIDLVDNQKNLISQKQDMASLSGHIFNVELRTE